MRGTQKDDSVGRCVPVVLKEMKSSQAFGGGSQSLQSSQSCNPASEWIGRVAFWTGLWQVGEELSTEYCYIALAA